MLKCVLPFEREYVRSIGASFLLMEVTPSSLRLTNCHSDPAWDGEGREIN